MHVGLLANIKPRQVVDERTRPTLDDLYSEWDSPETIEAVRAALASHPDVEVEII